MLARYSMGKSFILSFLLFLAASACFAVRQPVSLTLDNNWKFRMADSGNWLPAKVPGCVHTDLLNARRIDEPFFGTNEKKLQWIDKKDWEYETRFKLDASILKNDHLELIFEGLDTYAEVRLNGTLILKADNMFRSWKVDCIKWLKADNVLTIRFLSPIAVGLEKLEANGYALPNDNDDSKMGGLGDKKVSVFTRKAQFQYGWDWGPRFVTCGIWRPVKLLAWDELQISDLFVRDKVVNEKSAQLKANIEILSSIESQSTITLFADDKNLLSKKVPVKPGLNKFSFDFTIENPELWWSNGIGKQKLYNIKAGNYKRRREGRNGCPSRNTNAETDSKT
ncbi:MAG: hypothetical protein IPH88_10865 [Bacteroidales bacterium]|nr:hypothetical protein [Bacteroidales bacterium]